MRTHCNYYTFTADPIHFFFFFRIHFANVIIHTVRLFNVLITTVAAASCVYPVLDLLVPSVVHTKRVLHFIVLYTGATAVHVYYCNYSSRG